MGSIQIHNAERDALQIPDRQAYEHYHEPLGDFGVYNGQFEQGLAGRYANDSKQGVEGWELLPNPDATIDRVAGGLAGNWRLRGGKAGTGQGGSALGWKYIPVDEDRDYYISAAFITTDVAAAVYLQLNCYTAAKVFIGRASPVNNVAPGTSWVRYQRNVGPHGDDAFPANTRYVRVRVLLQANAALTGQYAYVDDVQFGQLKKTYSPLIRLVQDVASDASHSFNTQAFAVWTNSSITLTLEEPGYIWWAYQFLTRNTIAARVNSAQMQAFLDAGGQGLLLAQGHDPINHLETTTLVGRSDAIEAVGAHTVDVRILVTNAGDVVAGSNLVGYAFYTRAN